jgi:hypothetical protein
MPKKTDDLVKSRGLGLKLSEWEEIDQIADDLSWKPHAVVAYGVRYFLKAWRGGEIKKSTRILTELPKL